ncbi:hypothetical protein ACWDF9_04295 [Streptomyces rubiginosohelvolus]
MSKGQDGDEPIFIRSNWGTSRYVYNPRNPVGMGLIIGGEGPTSGSGVYVDAADDPYDKDADPSVDLFEVTAKDVDAAFCLSVSPPEPEPVLTSVEVSLSISVEEGRC